MSKHVVRRRGMRFTTSEANGRTAVLDIVVRSALWGPVALIDATTAGYRGGWKREEICSKHKRSFRRISPVYSLLVPLSANGSLACPESQRERERVITAKTWRRSCLKARRWSFWPLWSDVSPSYGQKSSTRCSRVPWHRRRHQFSRPSEQSEIQQVCTLLFIRFPTAAGAVASASL